MEDRKLTIMPILQALTRGVRVASLWENKVRMPSFFVVSSLLKTLTLCQKLYILLKEYMPSETRKLITFANYSHPSSSFVNIKKSVYSGIIPRFIPPKDNTELQQTFAQYGVNTPRWDSLGSNVRQRVNCLDAPNVREVFFKNDAYYGGLLGQK